MMDIATPSVHIFDPLVTFISDTMAMHPERLMSVP